MIRKFIITSNGEEVKYDDESSPLAELLTKILIHCDIIKEKPSEKNETSVITLEKVLDIIGKDLNLIPELTDVFMDTIWRAYPVAALNIILRTIALELDKKYPDNIRRCSNLYYISTLNGRIYPIEASRITNYKTISLFRNLEDAKIACSIVRPYLKALFHKDSNGK